MIKLYLFSKKANIDKFFKNNNNNNNWVLGSKDNWVLNSNPLKAHKPNFSFTFASLLSLSVHLKTKL